LLIPGVLAPAALAFVQWMLEAPALRAGASSIHCIHCVVEPHERQAGER